jgi:hypothetical protein
MSEHEIQIIDTHGSSEGEKESSPPELRQKASSLWTPAFIVFFALACILGLSLASVLTQGWLNGLYPGESILLGYIVIVFGLWLLLLIRSNHLYLRLAALFGLIWVFCTGCMLLFSLFQLNGVVAAPHLSTASSIALLGSFLGLSLNIDRQDRWERWFLRLAPLILLSSILIAFLLGQHTLLELENSLSGVALCLCIAIWWFHPFNWRNQPLSTLLFGLIPLIQLLFNFPHRGETNFFYTQILLLALILGLLRVLQKELRLFR